MSGATKAPPLVALVQAGEGQTDATPINDHIFMIKDISNAYLVTTSDGDVLVNSGMSWTAARTKGLVDKVRTGPLRHIFLTQAHADHFGGVAAIKEAETKVVAHKRFPETWQFFHDLHAYLTKRSGKLWAFNRKGPNPPPSDWVDIDILVEDRESFTVGNRTFELISTQGGESLCASVVWMPEEKTIFTGNLFGPVWLAMPNLTTTRGDKPRLVVNYLASLERVRALEPELLITGHGEPVIGKERIRADLDRLDGAVSYIRDRTIEGMNAGKSVHQLMREILLPDDLTIGEFHGNVRWAVRAIWDEHSGWFHYEEGTTGLYGVPRSSVHGDLVELAGGASALAKRAADHLAAGRALEAIHLLDIALDGEPANRDALTVKKAALEKLLADSGSTNLSETMWLQVEIQITEAALGENA
jgi:alkyl sulfatase BDS1-like metallo-beta-lactamase superfamily hydrolase